MRFIIVDCGGISGGELPAGALIQELYLIVCKIKCQKQRMSTSIECPTSRFNK